MLLLVLPLTVFALIRVPESRATIGIIVVTFGINAGIVLGGKIWHWLRN
jgi:hypothetical protein